MNARLARRRAKAGADEGFALVELLVGITLLAMILAVLGYALVLALRSQTFLTNRANSLDDLRKTMERTTRDIREGTVQSATPLALTVLLPGQSTSETWSQVGSSFGVANGSNPLSVQLANADPKVSAVFSYAGQPGYAPTATGAVDPASCQITAKPGNYAPDCVGTVTITLTATVSGHPNLVLADSVQLRNPA